MFERNRTVVETRRNVLLARITDMINQGRHFPVSQKAVRRRLYENNYHRRIIREETRIRDENRKRSVSWARGKRFWRVEGEWDGVIYTEEVMIGGSNGVYVWRRPGKDWMPDCLCPGPPVKVSILKI